MTIYWPYMQVRVLIASCGASFDERDVIVASCTDEGGEHAIRYILADRWNAKEIKDKEFWHDDFDAYWASWNINTTGTRLEP